MTFTILDNCLSVEGNGSENISVVELQNALTAANRNPAVTSLRFSEVYFDFSGISLLKVFLLENKVVNTLEISCNILKCDGLNRISEGFAGDTLKTLILRSNFVNVSDTANIRTFANYVCKSKSLATLCVRDNNICGGDARFLTNILAFNSSLKSLTLKETRLGDSGLAGICSGLCSNKTLTFLDISQNNYTDSGAKGLFDILKNKKNTTLKEIVLDSKISPKIVSAINTILKEKKVDQTSSIAEYKPRSILYSPNIGSNSFIIPRKKDNDLGSYPKKVQNALTQVPQQQITKQVQQAPPPSQQKSQATSTFSPPPFTFTQTTQPGGDDTKLNALYLTSSRHHLFKPNPKSFVPPPFAFPPESHETGNTPPPPIPSVPAPSPPPHPSVPAPSPPPHPSMPAPSPPPSHPSVPAPSAPSPAPDSKQVDIPPPPLPASSPGSSQVDIPPPPLPESSPDSNKIMDISPPPPPPSSTPDSGQATDASLLSLQLPPFPISSKNMNIYQEPRPLVEEPFSEYN